MHQGRLCPSELSDSNGLKTVHGLVRNPVSTSSVTHDDRFKTSLLKTSSPHYHSLSFSASLISEKNLGTSARDPFTFPLPNIKLCFLCASCSSASFTNDILSSFLLEAPSASRPLDFTLSHFFFKISHYLFSVFCHINLTSPVYWIISISI